MVICLKNDVIAYFIEILPFSAIYVTSDGDFSKNFNTYRQKALLLFSAYAWDILYQIIAS